jgi:hypothetical protein
VLYVAYALGDKSDITDASIFPSSGGGEAPSLTIQALALRTADASQRCGCDVTAKSLTVWNDFVRFRRTMVFIVATRVRRSARCMGECP